MNKHALLSVGLLLLASNLVGCASQREQEGATFLKAPEDISSAWVDGAGRVMMVPAKGVVVETIVDQTKGPVAFSMSGQYLVLPTDVVTKYSGDRLWLSIEGKLRSFDVPGSSQERYTTVHQ